MKAQQAFNHNVRNHWNILFRMQTDALNKVKKASYNVTLFWLPTTSIVCAHANSFGTATEHRVNANNEENRVNKWTTMIMYVCVYVSLLSSRAWCVLIITFFFFLYLLLLLRRNNAASGYLRLWLFRTFIECNKFPLEDSFNLNVTNLMHTSKKKRKLSREFSFDL